MKLQTQLKTGWDKVIQNMITDVLEVPLTLEDVQVIFNYVSATSTARQSCFSNRSHYEEDERRSTSSSAAISIPSKASTILSRPFTSLSYVSSSTAGTSLTQKIERMNRATLKLHAKLVVNNKQAIEQMLTREDLNLKSKLTVPELVLYLGQVVTEPPLGMSQI